MKTTEVIPGCKAYTKTEEIGDGAYTKCFEVKETDLICLVKAVADNENMISTYFLQLQTSIVEIAKDIRLLKSITILFSS